MYRCVMVYKISFTFKTLNEYTQKNLGQPLVINRTFTETVTIDTPTLPSDAKIAEIGDSLIAETNRKHTELVATKAKLIGYRSVRELKIKPQT